MPTGYEAAHDSDDMASNGSGWRKQLACAISTLDPLVSSGVVNRRQGNARQLCEQTVSPWWPG
jgi:hypothetical protein